MQGPAQLNCLLVGSYVLALVIIVVDWALRAVSSYCPAALTARNLGNCIAALWELQKVLHCWEMGNGPKGLHVQTFQMRIPHGQARQLASKTHGPEHSLVLTS